MNAFTSTSPTTVRICWQMIAFYEIRREGGGYIKGLYVDKCETEVVVIS